MNKQTIFGMSSMCLGIGMVAFAVSLSFGSAAPKAHSIQELDVPVVSEPVPHVVESDRLSLAPITPSVTKKIMKSRSKPIKVAEQAVPMDQRVQEAEPMLHMGHVSRAPKMPGVEVDQKLNQMMEAAPAMEFNF